ncbi:hypothetical protein JTB14_010634 [Gonioctena quinquepunctata]|nr:hypothetical protein JTB14_010634 [Gonioctena quinquepunctata]
MTNPFHSKNTEEDYTRYEKHRTNEMAEIYYGQNGIEENAFSHNSIEKEEELAKNGWAGSLDETKTFHCANQKPHTYMARA